MPANVQAIALTGTLLVLVTAGTVAVVAHALGLAWPMAFVLGSVLAPTDATAVSTVAAMLPRRARTVLRAESLINDRTALVIYAVAVGVAVGELEVGPLGVAWRLLASYAGGIAVGLSVALATVATRRRLDNVKLDNVLSVLTAFLAYLPAELLHASGVVAVATSGLTLTQVSARFGSARTRAHATAGLIALTVTTTRLTYTNTMEFLLQAVDHRPAQRLRRVGFRGRLPVQWAGFRGAVSLAAALAVPTTTVQGDPLQGRDTVLLVTFGVIVVLLVVQGLTLPAVIRFSRAEQDPAHDREQRLAEITAPAAAAAALPRRAAELDVSPAVRDKVRDYYQATLHPQHVEEVLDAGQVTDPDTRAAKRQVLAVADAERALLLALLEDEHEAVARLSDERAIDDDVGRRLHTALDGEEVRLHGVETHE